MSIDYRHGTTTGTSAHDRAITAKAITEVDVKPRDFQKPGHVFPLRAKDGGVLRRAGHTEAAVDLAEMAGMFPAGVICEVMNEDGTMARLPQLVAVAEEHGLKLISIADLIEHRRHREVLVARVAEATIPTPYGEFRSYAYESLVDGRTHVALVMGEVGDGEKVLTRVHSECLTGDVFGSLRCDCGSQLDRALAMVGEEGRGHRAVRPRSRGPGDRAHAQAAGLRAAGPGARHRRGEHRARLPRGPARLRDRRPDPHRPRREDDAAAHEQPGQARRPRRVRARDRGADLRCRGPPPRRTWSTCARSGRRWVT